MKINQQWRGEGRAPKFFLKDYILMKIKYQTILGLFYAKTLA
jgi:hypothetical protein